MFKFCFIVFSLVISSKASAVDAKTILPFSAKMLSGEEMSFPLRSPTLFLIGFEKSCILQIREWIRAIRSEKLLPSNVSCYVISVVDPKFANSLFVNLATFAVRNAIPKKEHGVVGIAVNDPKKFKDILDYDLRSQGISLALVDRHGVIQWIYQGNPNVSSKESLKQAAISDC